MRGAGFQIAVLALMLACVGWSGAAQAPKADSKTDPKTGWKARVAADMPLLGHRNWILIVDSAYPLENSAGIETIDTGSDQLTVVKAVLGEIGRSRHVRPVVTMDAELPFVPDTDAPGASAYREQIGKLLAGYGVGSQPHEEILKEIDEAGKTFHVLVLKTNMTIPYTSVFLRLDCKYWSADQEKRMRERMSAAPGK
jgi:hypothetical protein